MLGSWKHIFLSTAPKVIGVGEGVGGGGAEEEEGTMYYAIQLLMTKCIT